MPQYQIRWVVLLACIMLVTLLNVVAVAQVFEPAHTVCNTTSCHACEVQGWAQAKQGAWFQPDLSHMLSPGGEVTITVDEDEPSLFITARDTSPASARRVAEQVLGSCTTEVPLSFAPHPVPAWSEMMREPCKVARVRDAVWMLALQRKALASRAFQGSFHAAVSPSVATCSHHALRSFVALPHNNRCVVPSPGSYTVVFFVSRLLRTVVLCQP